MSSSRQFSDGRRPEKAPEKKSFVQTCNLLSQYMKEKGSLRDLNLEIGGKVESLEAIVKPGSSFAASPPQNRGKSAQPSSEKQSSIDSDPIIVMEDASNKTSTSLSKEEETRREAKAGQLTIFYSGRVLVFDDYPVDKVRELVSIAKKSSSQMSYGITPNTIQEKMSPPTSSAREGLPPRPQPRSGKQPAGISSNTCEEKVNLTANVDVGLSSRSEELASTQSEANGSDLPIARRSSLHKFLEKRKDRAVVRGPYQNQERRASSSSSSSSSKGDYQFDLNK